MPSPKICPYVDKSALDVTFHTDFVFHDAHRNIVCAFVKNALPPQVAKISTKLLGPAARTTDLRAKINGGVNPQSGIAGYYDYFGSPVEGKCRKTAFTMASLKKWADVFPLVEYTNAFYKELCPNSWSRQDAAIPDNVRIRKTVFSTLTVNGNFRTAKHKDTGDFEQGLGAMCVLHGDYRGLCLGFPDFGFCIDMQPRDLVFFDTHHFHCNTELERADAGSWSRLSCVFYFRTNLASKRCLDVYKEKMGENSKNLRFVPKEECKDESLEKASSVKNLNPASPLFVSMHALHSNRRSLFARLEKWFAHNSAHYMNIPCVASRPSFHFKDSNRRSNQSNDMQPHRFRAKEKLHARHLSAQKAFDYSVDYLDNLDLLGVPGEIQAAWRVHKLHWFEEIQKRYNVRHEALTWRSGSGLAAAFTALCDTAKEIFQLIMGDAKTQKVHKANFNALLGAHLIRAHNGHFTQRQLTLPKLCIKLLDYEHGGPRYPKAGQMKRRLRNDRYVPEISDAESAGEVDADIEETESTAKASDDCFDYQAEDVEVDYTKLGIEVPGKFVKERLNGVKSIETLRKPKICEKNLRILLLEDTAGQAVDSKEIPQAADVYGHVRSNEEIEMLKEEYDRLCSAFLKQSRQAPATWKEMEGVDINRKDVLDIFLEIFDAAEADVIFAPDALRARSTADQRHILQTLASFQLPLIFQVYLAEDPQHFLLRPEHQVVHTRAARDLYKEVTGKCGSYLLTSEEWKEQLTATGWELIGTYSVRGAALSDTYFVAVPEQQ